jgi:dihydrofolate synthase / folylpolyglutamate synthase
MTDREWLDSLELFGMKLGLGTIGRLAEALGHPERAYPVVHIAGTNGKGSVAAMMSTALTAAGHRAGRYTSPHLVRVEERAAIDGRSVSPAAFDRALARVRAAATALATDHQPTYFEITTAASFEIFRDAAVDVAVIEVGLGGRYDATNIVAPAVTVITSIDFDHEAHLGTTLEAIAGEKAGIVKPGVPVVAGHLPPSALGVVRRAASLAHAPLTEADEAGEVTTRHAGNGRVEVHIRTRRGEYGPALLGLRGRHQAQNAAVAVLALEACGERGIGAPPEAIVRGLAEARWPARLDLIDLGGRSLLVDGAHNASGAQALADYLRETYPAGLPLVFGVMADKALLTMLTALSPSARPLILTRAPGRRAADPETLAEVARALADPPEVIVERDVSRALELAWQRGNVAVVAGSLYLAGDVLARIGRAPA